MRQIKNQRALKVIRMMRLRQQKQAQQIDILCRDMVTAHQNFACKLAKMMDVAGFYETLLSCGSLNDILNAAVGRIQERIVASHAVVFLLDENGFEIHNTSDLGTDETVFQFQDWFSKDLIHNISLTPRISSLNQMLQMGLQGPPAILKTLSAAAIPLSRMGQAVGLVLVYRAASEPLTAEELSSVSSINTGLCHAILNLRTARQPLTQG